MEKELNIAEILKDKSVGTKLYADAFGELRLNNTVINNDAIIYTKHETGLIYSFHNDGKYSKHGEPILFPSKKMHDWSKFAWKKGDILVSNDGKTNVIFNKWEDDSYVSFYGRHYLNNENEDNALYYRTFVCTTEMYSIANKDIAKDYISSIEEKFGGKLNLKTLDIDKSQLEFKDGDILANPCILSEGDYIFIYKPNEKPNKLGYYVGVDNTSNELYFPKNNRPWCTKNENIRYATEEERQRLFGALNAAGKRWNAEKKVVEDIKTEHQFKPFERVLVRDACDDTWKATFFSHIKDDDNSIYKYVCNCLSWRQCVPYEGNEHLLGTTKDAEG